MTANEPLPYSLRLNRVFGPSLCPSKRWYAVSSEWFNRPRDFSAGPLLKDEIIEVSIYDLIDQNGAQMIPSLFGSTWKKDVVVVSTLFGILARALKKNNQNENKVLSSIEFKVLKAFRSRKWREQKSFPPMCPILLHLRQRNQNSPIMSHHVAQTKTPFEILENLESVSMGPRLKMRQSGAVAKRCVDEVQDRFTKSGSLLGKAFGNGFLYCDQGRQEYIKDAVSTTLSTVAQKQGIRKAIHNMLHDELNQQYLESIRVPDWIQLYVKLSTMIPNRSWQTLLNFLNIGRTGVSVFILFHLSSTVAHVGLAPSGGRGRRDVVGEGDVKFVNSDIEALLGGI